MKYLKRVEFGENLPAFATAEVYKKAAKRHNRILRWFKFLYKESQFKIYHSPVTDYLIIFYKELDYSI